MLANNARAVSVKARLKIDMVIAGEPRDASEVVELSARDFKYQANLDRVELAPAPKAK